MDWLSRLLEMIPVNGGLDYRCFLAAPWRIEYAQSEPGEIPYHIVLSGSVVLEEPQGGFRLKLVAGDIVLLINGAAHTLHDGGGGRALPLRDRQTLNLTITENDGTGDKLDMLCGRFVLSPAHERTLRNYLPRRIVVNAADNRGTTAQPGTGAHVAGLVGLLRAESAVESLGGLAMLNALSTALFTLTLRLASEGHETPAGLLTLAANPRLSPALSALFNEPAHAWTLPELARLCNMSRATFIRHFQDGVGRSAHDLLNDIRMTLAAKVLEKSEISTRAAAELVGYDSEAAFQRAFKQRMGTTPAQWRRRTRGNASTPRET